ncbi:MAG: CBS domain-containing protein [Gaiellales bacterium]
MSTVDINVSDADERTAGEVITVRGKELSSLATVGEARVLFESRSVQLVPVLDGHVFVGTVTRDDLDGVDDSEPIAGLAAPDGAPSVTTSTALRDALGALSPDGGRRVVVLGDDGTTYVGLICLSRDRQRLCVDAECHRPA